MSGAIDFVKLLAEWNDHFAADLRSTFELSGKDGIDPAGRRFLATALSYGVSQFDLIPDHEVFGFVDDAMAVRICYGLASEHAGELDVADSAKFARLANEEDTIKELIGEELHARFRRYLIKLADTPVRGRTSDAIISEKRVRDELKREVETSIKRVQPLNPPPTEKQADEIRAAIIMYLKSKLE
jgi:uncharacterized membrane protein YkvA (DUF1232 family)